MMRGDIVTVATGSGFGGKPRPALILQSDDYAALPTIALLLLTSTLADPPSLVRVRIAPDAGNGLRVPSEIMTDVPVTAHRDRVGQHIGRLSADDMARTERAFLLAMGFGG
jgi:mRNA interferase MazF